MGIQDSNETGVDISTTGTLAEFEPTDHFVMDITLTATAAVTIEVQVADRDSSAWQTSKTYSSVTSIDDVLEGAVSKIRLQVTSAAAGGETADYYVGVAN